MIKIGTQDFPAARRQAESARQELYRIGLESTVVYLDDPDSGILHGDIDVTVQPLCAIPLERPGELVVAALFARTTPADLLVARPEVRDNRQDFGLAQGATVLVLTPWQAAQLRDFRPDLNLVISNSAPTVLLNELRQGTCAAVVLPAAHLPELDISGLEHIELNPREFLPAPGQGALAWLTHRDNLPVRRLLKQVHHPDVSACTNVERRVLQLLGGTTQSPLLGAFVERDASGNFHAFSACATDGNIRRARLSQSTNFELAEQVVAGLR